MKVIILTGSEIRHKFFRLKISSDSRFDVIATFCEGEEKSLETKVKSDPNSSQIELMHVDARTQAEKDFFGLSINAMPDESKPTFIQKGGINDKQVVNSIKSLNADLIICYGSSIIKSELLEIYSGRFLNVHLGLSPYYRGTATNIWPLINSEPEFVGATFMYIDAGIDTGEIIHQVRPEIFLGDSPHSIGNRLIAQMTNVYADIIYNFPFLKKEIQPDEEGKLYFNKDFDRNACLKLYKNFSDGLIQEFLEKYSTKPLPYIVTNKALKN